MTKCRGILIVHEDGTPAACTARACPGEELGRHHVIVRCQAYGECAHCETAFLPMGA